MVSSNDNLPAHVATSMTEIGSITYASEVVAIIAGMAAAEIDGVAAMGASASIVELLGRKNKPVTRGVKVEVGSEEASVDLTFSVEYGKPIQKVCRDVQESVRKSIETMTGLHVVKVDVHVLGVSFEKETQLSAEMAQTAGYLGATGPLGQIVRSRALPKQDAHPDEPVGSSVTPAASPIPPKDEVPAHPTGEQEDVDLPEIDTDIPLDNEDEPHWDSKPLKQDLPAEQKIPDESLPREPGDPLADVKPADPVNAASGVSLEESIILSTTIPVPSPLPSLVPSLEESDETILADSTL